MPVLILYVPYVYYVSSIERISHRGLVPAAYRPAQNTTILPVCTVLLRIRGAAPQKLLLWDHWCFEGDHVSRCVTGLLFLRRTCHLSLADLTGVPRERKRRTTADQCWRAVAFWRRRCSAWSRLAPLWQLGLQQTTNVTTLHLKTRRLYCRILMEAIYNYEPPASTMGRSAS